MSGRSRKMPRSLDAARRPQRGFPGYCGTRAATWTGRFLVGWLAIFFLSCLVFHWPMPLEARGGKPTSSPGSEAEIQSTGESNFEGHFGNKGSGDEPVINPSPGGNEKREKPRAAVSLEFTASAEATSSAAPPPSERRPINSSHPAEPIPVKESSEATQAGAEVAAAHGTESAEPAAAHEDPEEDDLPSIVAIEKPFHQPPDQWRVKGHGISMKTTGEPKSGTTWVGTLVTQLCVELCASDNNPWCEMGGLVVTPNIPAARYEFEMMDKEGVNGRSPGLYMHFKGDEKHIIPGMDEMVAAQINSTCKNNGRVHANFFQESPPCKGEVSPTRSTLMGCLWDTSTECQSKDSPLDPSVMRNVVVVRDPRNVVMSERRMRIEYYKDDLALQASIDDFVSARFEALTSWTHQRWEWHSCDAMKSSSHIVFYEELQASHMGLVDVAYFLGLECTPEQAWRIWEAHRKVNSPSRDYSTQGLLPETVEFMNATMAKLLPVPLVLRYGLIPSDV